MPGNAFDTRQTVCLSDLVQKGRWTIESMASFASVLIPPPPLARCLAPRWVKGNSGPSAVGGVGRGRRSKGGGGEAGRGNLTDSGADFPHHCWDAPPPFTPGGRGDGPIASPVPPLPPAARSGRRSGGGEHTKLANTLIFFSIFGCNKKLGWIERAISRG